jgi:hypothetical protein
MEEGRQKSKRPSYTAKFKRELIWSAEGKGNCKAAAIFVFAVGENQLLKMESGLVVIRVE